MPGNLYDVGQDSCDQCDESRVMCFYHWDLYKRATKLESERMGITEHAFSDLDEPTNTVLDEDEVVEFLDDLNEYVVAES